MSLVPNLPLHAEFYGACALSRSRRLALMLTCGLCLAVLTLAHMQPKHSVRIVAVAPLAMDIRILPVSAPAPRPAMVPQSVPALRPLLAEHSPIAVNLPPAERVLPQEAPVVEKAPPQEKIKVREREKPKPKARQLKPVPKAAPAPTPVKAPESIAATASAAVADPVATAQEAGQNMGQPSGQSSAQSFGQASEQEKAVALGVLMQAIDRHKSYPKQARRTGAQGTVSLLVRVGQDGRVQGWEVQQGSGHVLLDSATRQLGEKLKDLDTGLRGKEVGIVVPVRYALR